MDSKEVTLLKKALERQKKARIHAEKILEEKSKELYDVSHHLKKRNERLENLLNEKTSEIDGVFINIVDPYIVMDLQFNILKMNISAKKFLGYDSDIEKVNLEKLVHKDYIVYTANSIKSLLEAGTLKNYRAKIIVKDGSEKFIQINSSLILDKNGKPIAAQGIVRDITQETEIKYLLAEQKRQLHIIIENSPLSIVLTNKSEIIKANNTFVNLLGYSEAELKKLRVDDISYAEDIKDSEELRAQMNLGKLDQFSVVKRYVRKNGTSLWAKTSVSLVKNEEGTVLYQIAMIEDITDQRNLELQKEQLLEELETSNLGLQEYAHIVSHDLKSPLRSISALATWLSDDYKDLLDESGVFNLQQIQEKIESMDTLINGILKYSSINNHQSKHSNVDFNTVIDDIKNIIFIPDHVQVMVTNKLPTLKADKTKIHQLFQNLISNAVMHIEQEKGLVEIWAEEHHNFWKFSIKDNGIGIPKAYHKKIFKIFQSIGNGERSTGIGLSIVKKIVDLHKGKVWLESEVAKGTTFYFTLKK